MKSKNQSGFAFVEFLVIVVVVAALSLIAIQVMNRVSNKNDSASTTVVSQAVLPSKIQSKTDVTQSIKSLDATPIDSGLDPSQFDSSISSLL